MTKVIWLGEDSADVAGPSFTTCYGLKFPKGEAVELTDPDAIRRAKGNLNFKVEETKQEDSHGESQTQDKVEDKKEEKDYREREKGTGYSPVKKKVRKKKPEDSPDTATTRVSTPNP